MEPPYCSLCDEWFEPSDGGRVAFADTEAWFCPRHLADAREHGVRRLVDALATMRLGETARMSEQYGADLPRLAYVACRPVPTARLVAALTDDLPGIAAALGIDPPGSTASTSRRDWTPMDGVVPPNCPYQDHRVVTAVGGRFETVVEHTTAWWNPDELANASVTCSVRDTVDDRTVARVRASTPDPADRDGTVDELSIALPVTPPQRALIGYVLDLVGRR